MRTIVTAFTAATLAIAVLVGGMSSAEASSKYSVTVAASTTDLKLGHSVTLSGAVSPGASGKTVEIQRKYAGGSWKTIAHDTLSSHSKYSKTIKPTTAAVTSYRVVKPHSSSHSTGASATKVVRVSRWRYLTDLPQQSAVPGALESDTATIVDRVYPHSIKAAGGGSITYKLGKACTAFTSVVGMDDTSSSGATAYATAVVTYQNNGGGLFGFVPVAVGHFGTYVTKETELTDAVYVQIIGDSDNNSDVVDYGTPQVYCAS